MGGYYMEQHEALCRSIKNIAWGYILIHIHINIGALDLLPDWCGYLLFIGALTVLGSLEPSAPLLKPLGIILAVWNGLFWILKCLGVSSLGYIPGLLISIISLYFHFQLLTNIAAVANNYDSPQEKSILTLRTVRTILTTLLALPFPWAEQEGLAIVILIVNLIVAFWLCGVMFSLHRFLRDNPPEESMEVTQEQQL